MTGRPVIGLCCAVIVELRHWIQVRWDFDEDDCVRAWQFTTIFIAIAAVLILLDGERFKALPSLLSWLPPLLLPMQFVQSYGMRDSVQLGVFSFLARRRRLRNQRLGLIEETVELNFGNVFFVVAMVASTVGANAGNWGFVAGLAVLTGWRLAGVARGWTPSLIAALVACAAFAVVGQHVLEEADDLIGRSYGGGHGRFSTKVNYTELGNAVRIDLPTEVLWRLKPSPGTPPPKLLQLGSYGGFSLVAWQNQLPPELPPAEEFKDLDSTLIGPDSYQLLVPADAAPRIPRLPGFTLRGAATDESPLPLPGDAAGLRDFDLLGAERNPFGTVRISPRHPVIDGAVFWKSGGHIETDPTGPDDLKIPRLESVDIIRRSVEELRLDETPTLEGKLQRIRVWFQRNFRYTTDLKISSKQLEKENPGKPLTPIGKFLSDTRAGHCEYFASAAALMLREAGIPTRYAVGYAVAEVDPRRGEFIIRRSHAHAWCRVWDETRAQWIDFDPTPGGWMTGVTAKVDWSQRLSDRIKWLREDFFIWRNKPNNRLGVSIVMITLGLGLGGFVARRLWKSRRNIAKGAAAPGYAGPVIRTPLNELENLAAKRLGQRPLSQPFGAWIAMLGASLKDPRPLADAIALHQKLRFDPNPVTREETERLGKLARDLEAELKARG